MTQWKFAHAARDEVMMSAKMGDAIRRWTAKREKALVLEIIHGKTTVAEVSRAY